MFTLFDLFQLVAVVIGVVVGAILGHEQFGIVGAIVGAVVGFFVLRFLGELPWRITMRIMGRALARRETDDLVAELRERRTLTPNFVLRELHRRGYDGAKLLPDVLGYLESEHIPIRQVGLVALRSSFPSVLNWMPNYSPTADTETCRAVVAALRASLPTKAVD